MFWRWISPPGKAKVLEYGEETLRKYFGGSGLAASILFDRFDPAIDAFHPESPLIFMTGLLTGVPVPCGCRVSVCAKSPLGHWGEANAGGYWGPELKFTGFDGIIITGQAKEPCLSMGDSGRGRASKRRPLLGEGGL